MNAIVNFDKTASNNQLGVSGQVRFHQCCKSANTIVTIDLQNLPPNTKRAIHIHEFGDISQGCMSAGPHYNPHDQKHGNISIDGKNRHVGDLVNNIVSDKRGNAYVQYEDDLIQLSGPYSVVGRSIVIHVGVDDLGLGGDAESLKTGNAGGRMACAVIGIAKNGPV
jgi:Cu-Zn family superoxide dismutase